MAFVVGKPDPIEMKQFLHAIAEHESGGKYNCVPKDPNNHASGAFGFTDSTWKKLGTGYDHAWQAPKDVQDKVFEAQARRLWSDAGGRWENVAAMWYCGSVPKGENWDRIPGPRGTFQDKPRIEDNPARLMIAYRDAHHEPLGPDLEKFKQEHPKTSNTQTVSEFADDIMQRMNRTPMEFPDLKVTPLDKDDPDAAGAKDGAKPQADLHQEIKNSAEGAGVQPPRDEKPAGDGRQNTPDVHKPADTAEPVKAPPETPHAEPKAERAQGDARPPEPERPAPMQGERVQGEPQSGGNVKDHKDSAGQPGEQHHRDDDAQRQQGESSGPVQPPPPRDTDQSLQRVTDRAASGNQ